MSVGLTKLRVSMNSNPSKTTVQDLSQSPSTSSSANVASSFSKMQKAKIELTNANTRLSQSTSEVSSSGARFANVSSSQEMLNFNHQQDQTRVGDLVRCIQSLSSAIDGSVNNLCAKDQKILKSFNAIKQIDSSISSTNSQIISHAQIIENADKLSVQKDKQYKQLTAVYNQASQFDNQVANIKGQIKSIDLQISSLKKKLLGGGVTAQQPKMDVNGNPVIDQATGKPVMETKTVISTADIQAQIDKLEQQKSEMEGQISTLQGDKGKYLNDNNELLANYKDLEKRCAASQQEKTKAQNAIISLNKSINNYKMQKLNQQRNILGLHAEKAMMRKKIVSDSSCKQGIENKLLRAEKTAEKSGKIVDSNSKVFNGSKGKLEASMLNNTKMQKDQMDKKTNYEASFELYRSLKEKPDNQNLKKLNVNG